MSDLVKMTHDYRIQRGVCSVSLPCTDLKGIRQVCIALLPTLAILYCKCDDLNGLEYLLLAPQLQLWL